MGIKKMIIIGANGSAYKRTIPALKDSQLCKVTAIQSRNEEKLKHTCEEFGIDHYYTKISEMLQKEDFDLIYIANPPFLHKQTIAECISSGKPIICEKPLASSFKEAMEIKEMLNGKKIPFMVAHYLRHQKAYADLKEILFSKEIGNVVSVWGQWGFEIKTEASSSVWKLDKEKSGGGTLNDNGIHVLDFLISLFGMPETVTGKSRMNGFSETFSNELMILSYKDKDLVINSSHTMPFGSNRLSIYGTSGSIEVEGLFTEKSVKRIIIKSKAGEKAIEYEPENCYKNEVENFIRFYLSQQADITKGTSLDEAVDALRLIEQMRENQIR